MEYGQLLLNPSREEIPHDFGELYLECGLDTETKGLHTEDRAFSYQLSDGKYTLYWNLQHYDDAPYVGVVSEEYVRKSLEYALSKVNRVYVANAKYDMWRLHHIGIDPMKLLIMCNHSMFRVIKSNSDSVSLSTQGEHYGYPKDDAVENYIKEHKLYEYKELFGYQVEKKPLYSKVPWSLIQPYACRDAYLSLMIGRKEVEDIRRLNMTHILKTEAELTRELFYMELKGIDVNREYVVEKIKYHAKEMEDTSLAIGFGFTDSAKWWEAKFKELGLPITLHWKKRTPTFTTAVLEKHRGIKIIDLAIKFRGHRTLLKNFYLKIYQNLDKNNKIHADLCQYAAKTARMSAKQPTLANLPSRTGKEVKMALVPPEDYLWYMPDYQAAELRITYDRAKESRMIDRVLQGEDMHATLAGMARVTRDEAKTVQFANIYGSGVKGMSNTLKRSEKETRVIVANIRKNIPNVEKLKKQLQHVAKIHGAIKNPFGRIVRIDKGDEYKALNYYIQSCLADVIKLAIVKISQFLRNGGYKSYLTLSVHDSLLVALHKQELYLQTKINELMKKCYEPLNGLYLEVTSEHSLASYGEPKKGMYNEEIKEAG